LRSFFTFLDQHPDQSPDKHPDQPPLPIPCSEQTKTFAFDFSYWSHDTFEDIDGVLTPTGPKYATQQKVFDDLGKGSVLANAIKGFNCSLFAYGQTGTETYTFFKIPLTNRKKKIVFFFFLFLGFWIDHLYFSFINHWHAP